MTDYQKMYTLLFNAITDALMQELWFCQRNPHFRPAKGRRTLSISRGRKRQTAVLGF